MVCAENKNLTCNVHQKAEVFDNSPSDGYYPVLYRQPAADV